MAQFSEIQGKVLEAFDVCRGGDDHIAFKFTDGSMYMMYHSQACCESVEVETIVGDLSRLVGQEILTADVRTNEGESTWGSATWTFYCIRGVKESVDIRWFGESNGYYSEGVDFVRAGDPEEWQGTYIQHKCERIFGKK